jgi:hypothetical protein
VSIIDSTPMQEPCVPVTQFQANVTGEHWPMTAKSNARAVAVSTPIATQQATRNALVMDWAVQIRRYSKTTAILAAITMVM